ncbi:MAG: hypothetical protein M8364_02655 [Methylobacter sp.]|uniref:hypothetical protein n=1 Tax=Methylobacter sp. TaxID=2051955 RepID=UPI002590CB77|nr:hypothetical protein [Methylobacter sp.]MCL7419791.1 hypothetical protein [Methylobacter sp.]
MSSEQDYILEIELLSERLDAVYSEWKENQPKIKPGYADANSLINLTMALAFCTDPEMQKDIEKKLESLRPKEDVIDLSFSPRELISILQGLHHLRMYLHAKQYLKESVGKDISTEKRWTNVAEIMLIKEPGEEPRLHDDEAFIYYWATIKSGLAPRKASEEVFKKFKFPSQEACDQWLKRQVNKRKKESPVYANIPAPSTSPRLK